MKYRDFIEGVWKGEGIGWFVLFPFLYPLSLLYRVYIESRAFFFKRGILPSYSPPLKVVSIGNITVGGSGKTPLTIYLASLLSGLGYKVAVLSRGYGGKGQERVNVVSDGGTIYVDPLEAGDEPYLIASKLKGVPVLTGKDRYELALYSHEHFGSDVVILDDGFQHLKLKRDIDILLLNPGTLTNSCLLPAGRLREPLKAVQRADIVFVRNRGQGEWSMGNGNLQFSILNKVIFSFGYHPLRLNGIYGGEEIGCEDLRDKKVIAFSGIADPSSFDATLRDMGAIVKDHLIYPDHYIYKRKDIEEIMDKGKAVDFIITTEKDGVKIKGLLPALPPVYALEVGIALNDANAFLTLLLHKIGQDRS